MRLEEKIVFGTFEDFADCVQKGQTSVTFWGTRQVTVKDFEGSVSIDFLRKYIQKFTVNKEYEYSPQERALGKAVCAKISEFYDETDKKISLMSCWTKFFVSIRDMFDRRFYWKSDTSQLFEYYTIKQWIQTVPQDRINNLKNSSPLRIFRFWDPFPLDRHPPDLYFL